MEIMQFNNDNKDRVYNWVRCTTTPIHIDGDPALKILTPTGIQTARIGDYITKHFEGAYSVIHADAFILLQEKYEQYIKEW
ncbi:hypothetical protein FP76_gp076 [Bacillus phage Evoli]|uniref:Uncharacterized protein n=1 Tax=Bacillus phage Evoli TaxID=1486658 RepID=A0A024B1Z1_9CAUD|nr:hypothetical protein FP76_gp076 [Bacillus phage Evoli]AHZ10018.1 hypothetical protein [Bacillus phage Evoli]